MDFPNILPIIILQNDFVLFPGIVMSVVLQDAQNIEAVRHALKNDPSLIGVTGSMAVLVEEGEARESYPIGCLAKITEHSTNPDGTIDVAIEGLKRILIEKYVKRQPYYTAEIQYLENELPADSDQELTDLIKKVKKEIQQNARYFPLARYQMLLLLDAAEPGILADLIAFFLMGRAGQDILQTLDVKERLQKAAEYLWPKIAEWKIQCETEDELDVRQAKTREESQKESYLRGRMYEIRKILGGGSDIQRHREALEKASLPSEAKKEALDTLDRLSSLPDYAAERAYLEAWLDLVERLPWQKTTPDDLDIKKARAVLDEDHYGLEKVKERIIQFLAVRKLKKSGKGPLICFLGPPGTGKTSVGRSIARAMGRKFIRVSLGGVHDATQIRGHSRTYVGALPGMIIANLKRIGVKNPVFMIDEIDKIGTSPIQGDPSSALLEVLDPEQNSAFVDHYLNMPFDLSEVLFITTGNVADTIQPALKDRMEIIEFPAYTTEEKLQIAKRHLIPKQMEEHGLVAGRIEFQDEALQFIIKNCTEEAGVRELERQIAKCCRVTAAKIAEQSVKKEVITPKKADKLLDSQKRCSDEKISTPGIAKGLAWTPYGGKVILIESEKIRETESDPIITGNIEKIMRESVRAALTFVEANRRMLGIELIRLLDERIHIHVPSGSVPKDGPSAGLAVFVALVSLFRKQMVKDDVAITGEITLRGAVLPIGGVKAKILAAKEAGIKTVILPEANRRDTLDLPKSIKEAIGRGEFHLVFVSEMTSAVKTALEP